MKTILQRSIILTVFTLFVFFSAISQVTIVSDGLNNSTTLFTLVGGVYYNGTTDGNDEPINSPLFIEGTHARGISNGTATLTSSDINTSAYSGVSLQFRAAAFGISGGGIQGLDLGDYIRVEISPDGGANYYNTMTITGVNNNTYWAYNTAIATTTYDGDGTSVIFTPAGTGDRTATGDGYSVISVTNLPSVTNLRFRITLLNNDATEVWCVDDFKVTGYAVTNYYSFGNTNPNSVNNWWTNTNGTGAHPANFTTNNQKFIIQNGHTYSTNANWVVSGTNSSIEVQSGGTLVANDIISGANSNFSVLSGGNLEIKNANGITVSAASGNIQVTGTRIYNAGANYIYSGAVAQVTGDGLSQNFPNSLTINNSSGVTLSGNVELSSSTTALTLTNGRLILGNFYLALQHSASSIGGTPNSSNMVVTNGTGLFYRYFTTGDTPSFTFPVGENTGTAEYSPFTLDFSANSVARFIAIKVTDATHPNNGAVADYLSRYWSLTATGAGTYTYNIATFNYLASDVVGSEANMRLNTWNGSAWLAFGSSTVGTNQIAITSSLNETTAPLNLRDFTARTTPLMTYVSSTTTQANTSDVFTNTTNNEVIGVQIVTSGSVSPLTVSSFTFNTAGTTNVADITNARLWTTGTSATFATTTQLGAAVAAPSGAFTINSGANLPYTLSTGTNYFWLTYDVPSGAIVNNIIDATCTSLTVVSAQTPTVQAPAGSRTIKSFTFDGTFSSGTSFAANGMYVVNGATNQWVVGTATHNGAPNCAHISNDAGTTNAYTLTTTQVSHFYFDKVFPAGQTEITLNFDWKGFGESTYDGLKVFIVPTTTTPVAGTQLVNGVPATTIQLGSTWYNLQNSWQSVSLTLDPANAGTTKRIVFSWVNDNSLGTQPPAAVDNINITTVTPCSFPATQATAFSVTGVSNTTIDVSWTRGNGDNVLVVARQGVAPTDPTSGVSYAANAAYGSGDAAGGGFAVYNGTGTNVTVTGLTTGATYYFAIYEYNNSGTCYNKTELAGSSVACGSYTIPYSESFESITIANTLPGCMAATNLGTLTRTYVAPTGSYNQYARTGTDFASFRYSSNDWIFTPGLELTGGVTYRFSGWYITDGLAGWTTLQASFGNAQNSGAMTGAITGASVSNATNTSYQKLTGTFTPATTGIYYVGINCVATGVPWYLSIDDIQVYIPNNQTTIVDVPTTQITAGNISSLANANTTAVDVFKFDITDMGSGDGISTFVTNFTVKKAAGTADWTDHIAGAELWNDGIRITNLDYTISDTEIAFSKNSGSFEVIDGTSEEITLKIWLENSGIVDNSTMQFTVSQLTHGFSSLVTGSEFASDFGSATTSNIMTVRVIATQLNFTTQPSITATSGIALTQQPAVSATDINGNVDLDFTSNVTLSNTGGLTMTNNTFAAVAGVATFTTFTFTSGGKYVFLNASGGSITSLVPSTEIGVDIIGCIIYQENFNDAGYSNGNLPRNGWLVSGTLGSTDQWRITTNNTTLDGSRYLEISNGTNDTYQNNNAADIIAYWGTLIDASYYKNLTIQFNWSCVGNVNDYASIVWSTDGTNWQNATNTVLNLQNTVQSANIDISQIDGQQFYIGFRWINNGANPRDNTPIKIDNIIIRGFPKFNYNFSYRYDEFEPIIGTVVTTDVTEGANIVLPAGYNFKYDGVNVTNVRANIKGWLQMGISYTANAAPVNNLYEMTQVPFLAPLWDNLSYDEQTRIIYLSEGTSPSRIFTIEWRDIMWGGERQNFQVKLYETSNMIEFHYGIMNNPSLGSASIGINNLISGSCMNKIISVTPGTTPLASYTAENNSINSVNNIPSGTVYIFNPLVMQNYSSWQAANVVVGQANFTSASVTINQSTTPGAKSSVVSSKGVLAIASGTANRVMIWSNIQTANGQPADFVIGQPNFTSSASATTQTGLFFPNVVAFSPDGNKLLVGEGNNKRVLIYDLVNGVPTGNGQAASVVVGQDNFTTVGGGCSSTRFETVTGLYVTPDGKLFITDPQNNRVLVYNSIPTTNGAAADVVIGQANFTTNTSGSTSNKLDVPWDCAYTSDGKLLISDNGNNNRILIFNEVPTSNNAYADLVIGNSVFGPLAASCTRSTFNQPSVTTSCDGKIAIADFNHRVMIYNRIPSKNKEIADVVLGQPNFVTDVALNNGYNVTGSPSNKNIMSPYSICFDLNGRLYVNGDNMHRVMIYGDIPTETSDLAISIVSDEPEVCIYSDVVYTVQVTNNGPDHAFSVVVNAQLPVGFTHVDYEASLGSTYNQKSGYWTIPYIANGQTVTLTFTGSVNSSLSGKNVTAYANVLASSQKDNNFANNGVSAIVAVKVFSAPQILTDIADQYINRNSHTIPVISFNVDDEDGLADITSYTISSSNPSLIPVNYATNLLFGGVAPNKTLDIYPAAGMYGYADLELTITDLNGCLSKEEFTVAVGNIWEGDVLTDEINWHNPLNWTQGVPNAIIEAIIPTTPVGGYYPVVKPDGECLDLYIEPRAYVSVSDGYKLNVTNNVYLESDASGTASVVDLNATKGNVTVVGTVNVERYLTHDSWHYVSIPLGSVSNKVFTDACSSYNRNLIRYKENYIGDANGDGFINMMDGWEWPWLSPNNNMLEIGRGYANYITSICTNTVTMSDNISADDAKLNTGDISFQITNQDVAALGSDGYLAHGWNLIGNPYPSGLDALDFIAENVGIIDGALSFWGKSGTTGFFPSDYATINMVGATNAGSTGVMPDKYISIGQGFVVHKAANGSDFVSFKNSMRETENSYFYKETEEDIIWRMYMVVENPDKEYNDLLIAFKEDATDIVDYGYDALKIKGNPNLAFYSKIANLKYTIQTLGFITETKSVKIGLDVKKTGVYIFSLHSLQNFPDDIIILLEDTEENVFIDLREINKYSFEIENIGEISNRFVLHFNPNNAPIANNLIENQQVYQNQTLLIEIPSDAFVDNDYNDFLDYSFSYENNMELPSWIVLNGSNLSVFPTNSEVGTHNIKYTATDKYGISSDMFFNIEVLNVNDAPFVVNNVDNQIIYEDVQSIINIPVDIFMDIDNDDVLSYTYKLDNNNLPSWIVNDIYNEFLQLIPGNNEVGIYSMKIIATDMEGATAETDFMLEVVNVNDPPYIVNPILDFNLKVNDIFTLQINNLIFSDIDVDDRLEYSFSLLPSWLSFDSNLNLLFGIPSSNDVGAYNLSVTANDLAEESVTESFNVFVEDLVGIIETESMVMVYPNPSDGLYIVKINEDNINLMSYSVVDITGKKIITDNTGDNAFVVDLRNFSSGVYFLEISVNNQIFTKKLIMN